MLNVAVTAGKLTAGVLGGSSTLVASGLHSASDLLMSAISWFSARVAQRPPDERHPYGYGRVEILAAVLVFASLTVVGWEIITGAVGELRAGVDLATPPMVLVLIPLGVAVAKEWFYRRLRGVERRVHSHLVHATAVHQRADAFGALFVIVAVAVASGGGLWQVDRAAALVLGLVIGGAGLGGLWSTIHELLFEQPDEALVAQVRLAARTVEGQARVVSVRVRRSGHRVFVEAVLAVAPDLSVAVAAGHAERLRRAVVGAVPSVQDVVVATVPLDGIDAANAGDQDEEPVEKPSAAPRPVKVDEGRLGQVVGLGVVVLVLTAVSWRAMADLGTLSLAGRFVRLGLLMAFGAAVAAHRGASSAGRPGRRGLWRWGGVVAVAVTLVGPGGPAEAASLSWPLLAVAGVAVLVVGSVAAGTEVGGRRSLARDLALAALSVMALHLAVGGRAAYAGRLLLGGAGGSLGPADGQAMVLLVAGAAVIEGVLALVAGEGEGPLALPLEAASLALVLAAMAPLAGVVTSLVLVGGPLLVLRGGLPDREEALAAAALGSVAALLGLRVALHAALGPGPSVVAVLLGMAVVVGGADRAEGAR